MSNGLREYFAEVADEARPYQVGDAVVRTARRRHRAARLAPALVAAAVVAGVLVAWLPLAGGGGGDAADRPGVGSLTWLPRQWTVPASAPPLPAGRAVGPAALVYQACPPPADPCPHNHLLTRRGEQYRLDGTAEALSPDGRWVVTGDTARDLTSTTTRQLGDAYVVGWSPDGRRVALEPRTTNGTNPDKVRVMTLASGEVREVPVRDPDFWAPAGMFPSGDLLLGARQAYTPAADPIATPPPTLRGGAVGRGIFVAVADGRTGVQRGLTISLDGLLDPREQVSNGPAVPLFIGPDGRTLLYQLDNNRGAGDLLLVDAQSGRALRRYRLPMAGAKPGPAGRVVGDRVLFAWGADGALLAGRNGNALVLELLDPETGARVVVADPPADARLLLPGARSWTY